MVRIEHLVPATNCGDDIVVICGPCEGLGIIVGFGEEMVDSGLEVGDRAEDAALQPVGGELGEVSLDEIEQTSSMLA